MKKETPISLRHLRRITAILLLCPISLSSIQASVASDQSDVSSASVCQEQTSGFSFKVTVTSLGPNTTGATSSITHLQVSRGWDPAGMLSWKPTGVYPNF